jgi:two-component system, chemotaxis family, CheB/CheR fusion protein
MTDITRWKVILVDDEPDSLNLIHDILALNGAEVYRAAGGEQCLTLLSTVTPTLVVLDLAMPKPDGWDLLKVIRAAPTTAHLPVVAVTAYYSDAVTAHAYQAGFNAFFPKPIKVNGFLHKLKEVAG